MSSSSLSGSGAMTEETNKRDGGGRGKKRRRHDDELEAVVAELVWRPAVAAAVAAAVVAAAVAAAVQRNPDCRGSGAMGGNARWTAAAITMDGGGAIAMDGGSTIEQWQMGGGTI